MQHPLEIARVNRLALAKIIESHSLEQLNIVPQGFQNNLIWNIAHVVVTQQLLMYKLSGLTMQVSDDMVEKYKKGTKVQGDVSQQEVDKVKKLLFATLDQTEQDLKENNFKTYTEYPTSTGFVLKSIDDALQFNNFHEGIHLGYILALKKNL